MEEELACVELVERVTDYLEGALTPRELERLQAHLSGCDGCHAHLEQMRAAVRVMENASAERLSADAEEDLLGVFRAWSGARRPGDR
jgi:anti-sigma factor RsiW